jgi:hypothetical protein
MLAEEDGDVRKFTPQMTLTFEFATAAADAGVVNAPAVRLPISIVAVTLAVMILLFQFMMSCSP